MVCVNSVCVEPSYVTLQVGKWYYGAYATVCPSNADCKEVQWHSDNSSVASVNASSGYICANGVGTAHIYATATDGSGCNDYLTVTVSNTVKVGYVELNRTSLSLEKGTSYTLSATVCPENATNKKLNWSSSNSNIATVSNGVVCGISNGTAIITATAADGSGACDCCTVTVTGNILVNSITVSPSTKTLKIGNSASLKATVLPSNATNKNISWQSSNNSVAFVNESSGIVTAKAEGSATIYAIAQDGSGQRGSCVITVPQRVGVTSVSVSPSTLTMTEGRQAALSATVFPSNATNKGVSWHSSNSSVATVGSRTGCVSALSAGTATITAKTDDGNFEDDCTVTVNEAEEDTREKVTITKEGDNFRIVFENDCTWKSISYDLNEYKSGHNLWNPDEYDQLNQAEKNYLFNCEQQYTKQKLAFLYLFDPFGVSYYVENNIATLSGSADTGNHCIYKDSLYYYIFGRKPRLIDVTSNDNYTYLVYPNSISANVRNNYYSDAEVIFGTHTIPNVRAFVEFLVDTTLDLLGIVFPQVKVFQYISNTLTCARLLLYSGSIVNTLSSVASNYLNGYISDAIEELPDLVKWPNVLYDYFNNFAEGIGSSFKVYNVNDITIYNKIDNQDNYNVIFKNGSKSFFMKEIIDLCS